MNPKSMRHYRVLYRDAAHQPVEIWAYRYMRSRDGWWFYFIGNDPVGPGLSCSHSIASCAVLSIECLPEAFDGR